jgi:hypothetical protein
VIVDQLIFKLIQTILVHTGYKCDVENNVFIYVPPTRDVVRNIALTDNIAFLGLQLLVFKRDVDAVRKNTC